jgi:hypothetical protein
MLGIKLGIVGTAKNTGKTTATAAIMQELRERDTAFFLTSIGYDGESVDNVTCLPKPKLRVEPGDVVASAGKCLEISSAQFQIIQKTDIQTPLGNVQIVRVTKSGLVIAAGPNKSLEAGKLAAILRRLGPGVTLFDGALNRIAPIAATDGFILATGASRNTNIPQLAAETGMMWRLSTLPKIPRAIELSAKQLRQISLLDQELSLIKSWPQSSLLAEEDIDRILAEPMAKYSYLYVPGIIGERALKLLADKLARQPRQFFLTVDSPIKLLVSGNPTLYYQLLQEIEKSGVIAGVVNRVPLLAITINPFFPEYRMDTKDYKPASVDFVRLQVSIQNSVEVPVFNVVRQGAKELVDIIMASAKRWEYPDTNFIDNFDVVSG